MLLDLGEADGLSMPERFQALKELPPFGKVFRYDSLPLEDDSNRHSWSQLLKDLDLF